MNSTVVAASTAVAIGGVAISALGWRRLEPAWHVLRNDPIPVRDLLYRDGPVEVEGVARVNEEARTATALFSGTACLAYEYEAQEFRGGGQHSHWETVDEGLRAIPFFVEDNSGTVSVDPRGAELHLETETLTIEPSERPPERIERYIRQTEDLELQNDTIDLVITELNTGNKQRFIERRLDVDEPVHVYGAAGDAPAGEWGSGQVDAVVERIEEIPLVISDSSERGTAWRLTKSRLTLFALGAIVTLVGLVGLVYGSGI